MADTLSQIFATAGNTLRPTATGFRCGHEPIHRSSSGECVSLDPAKGLWYCYSCQQGGGPVEALMSLRGVTREEAAASLHAHDLTTTDGTPVRKTQAEQLIEAAHNAAFFHDEYREPWAVVPVDAAQHTYPVRSRNFKRWLVHRVYAHTGRAPNSEAIHQALALLEARAVFDGPQYQLALRVAWDHGAVCYDLADAQWQCVVVTRDGWRVESRPFLFRHGGNTAAQVLPVRGGNLRRVLQFVTLSSEHDRLLFLVYLVTALIPDIPHPIPLLEGAKGSTKSTTSRLIRRLIDPAIEDLLALPNDQNELALLLAKNYVPAFDNLDGLTAWQSDMLCRASTGAGITKRRLYTDEEEVILKFKHCAIINGINPGVTRPDLLDRTLPFHLDLLPKDRRREEAAFWRDFDQVRPQLVGAMLDALSAAMRIYSSVRLSGLPRMADFCRWGVAVAEALGLGGAQFLEAYNASIGSQNDTALQSHPVAAALLAMLHQSHGDLADVVSETELWRGTASELLDVLETAAAAERIDVKAKGWPKAANALSRRLNEIKSNLRECGIVLTEDRSSGQRILLFHKGTENIVITVSTVTDKQNQGRVDDGIDDNRCAKRENIVIPPEETRGKDDTDADPDDTAPPPSPCRHPQPIAMKGDDDSDDHDDIFPTLSAVDDDNGEERAALQDKQHVVFPDDAFVFLPDGTGPHTTATVDVGPSMDMPEIEYIITSVQLDAVLPVLCEAPVLGIDTETTGLDSLKDRLRLIQFALPDRVIVIDAGTCPVQQLAPVFVASHQLAFYNAKFDLKFLRAAGLPWPEALVFDTMLAAQLLGAGTVDGMLKQCSLAAVVQRYLHIEIDKALQTSDWTGTLTPAQLCYAAKDAHITLQLIPVLRQALASAGLEHAAAIECRCVPALAWLEMAGLPIHVHRWRDRAMYEEHQEQALEAQLCALLAQSRNGSGHLFPEAMNWQSPQQVLDLLRHRGHALTTTDSETLAALVDTDPVIPLLLDYREAAKRAGTYGVPWLNQALHPVTGRVHADYLQLGSRAGRMSCTKPNVQNLPRTTTYRGCIAAEPNSCIIKADYSQLELRIAAVVAQDAAMLAAFQAGQDFHIATAAHLLGVPPEQVTSDNRQLAKAVNFGLLYGMGAATLQTYGRQHYRVNLSHDDAERYRQRFFNAYTGLRQWHQETGASQPTETRTIAGRRRLAVGKFTERLNSPVQGTGADGLKEALAQLYAHQDEVPDARLIAVVHDEIVAECPREAADQTVAWLQQHMTEAMQGILGDAVPVVVETTIGQDWAGTPLLMERTC